MKFFVDQQLPPALASWLVEKGHEATHVFFIGLGAADDRDIWDHALATGGVIVSKDVDFADRRGRSATGPQVIWLRIGNSTAPALLAWLDRSWSRIESALKNGRAVIEVR